MPPRQTVPLRGSTRSPLTAVRAAAGAVVVTLGFLAGAACSSTATEPPAVLTTGSLAPDSVDAAVLGVEVIEGIPHRTNAFTQGLVLDGDRMFESTGIRGRSQLAELNPATGEAVREVPLGHEYFGEGLALVDDQLIQLTWEENVAFVWDADTFEMVGQHRYDGEGWGLCYDGDRLVMTDGSDRLTFRDPDTFEEIGSVAVELDGQPVPQLNELACVDDLVYANVWMTEHIMQIDPASGTVTAVVDASPLRALLVPAPTDPQAVLNGIAHDPTDDTFWLTGKNWPQMFRVRLVPQADDEP